MKIRRKDRKGKNGRVLVVGGSKDYVGAPAFAAFAALRTGVDLVTVCAPEKVAWALNSLSPDMITRKFLGDDLNVTHAKEIISLAEENDVVVLGCGLGKKKDFVLKLLREIQKPFVLDADALKVVTLDAVSRSILTPHEGEFRMLYDNTVRKPYDELDIQTNIKTIKRYMGDNVILLKGPTDIIFTKHRRHHNKSGHNSMTIGGTGDILAGLCGGFLAQTGDLYESAKEAAIVNGKTGEYMFKTYGYGYTAYDLVKELWRFTK